MKKLGLNDEARKKWENFWYYYKFHVAIGIFILVCLVIFIRDIVTKIDYDYSVAFLGDYSIPSEDQERLREWFEENGEDLNGDGEIHVQIADYNMPAENQKGYDAQMMAASQTKFTVDIQSGESMLFFVSESNRERFAQQEVFSEKDEDYTAVEDCKGFQETGSLASIKDLYVTMRLIRQDSKQSEDEDIQRSYQVGEETMEKFIEGSGK